MKFTDTMFIHTVWFVRGGDKDFLVTMYRDGNGPWICRFRFRYHHDGPDRDPFDNKDERRTYKASGQDGSDDERDRMIEAARVMTREWAGDWGGDVDEVLIDGGVEAYLCAMRDKPWVHIRVMETPQ